MSDDLEPADGNEPYDFPPPERRVVTQSYDLSIQTLADQWSDELLVLPEIQREYVWDNGRASRLIESLILNLPIPSVYFAETESAKFEIIDGHQRIRSIVRYLANEFRLGGLEVLSEYRGLRYHQLPDREQRFLRMRSLRAVVISIESHPRMKFEIFERLNRGSIALNEQELRNSVYHGTFNRLLRHLVLDNDFRAAIGTAKPRKRMVDEELALRFLALHDRLHEYRPPLKHFLSDYMRDKQHVVGESAVALEQSFRHTASKVRRLLGPAAFRVANRAGEAQEAAVNRALFDAHMLAIAGASPEDLQKNRPAVLERLGRLYADPEFDDSIRLATGDRSRLLFRVGRVVESLTAAGVGVPPSTQG